MRDRQKRVLSSVYVDDLLDAALGKLAGPRKMTKDELASAFVTKGLNAFGTGNGRIAKRSAGVVIASAKAVTRRNSPASLLSIFVPEDVDGKLSKYATGNRSSKGEAIRKLTLMGIEEAVAGGSSRAARRQDGTAASSVKLRKAFGLSVAGKATAIR